MNFLKQAAAILALFAGIFTAQQALADSSVYVTNTTPETVSVSVRHSSNGQTLEQGSQWGQDVTEIGPYETKKILHFNRYQGLKSGTTYNFDTTLTSGDSTVTLKQSMTGTWTGSNIQHAAEGKDFSSEWMSDRDVHRYDTEYLKKASEMAFKAEFTWGYDDFHYTIHQKTVNEPVSTDKNEFKVLAYNIYALPLVASKIDERLNELPKHLKGYDAIVFEEAFAPKRTDLLSALSDEYPYQTHIPKGGFNVFDSGVVIVSRYPIANTSDYIYPECSGTDCFANKGVIYAEIIKDGKAYHVAGTHTASFDTTEARDLRQKQFKQIRSFIDAKEIPDFDAVLIGGDLNVNKLLWPDDYASMLKNLNATAPVSTGYTASTFDPRVNKLATAPGSGGTEVEYLDYVLSSNTHRQPVKSSNDVRVLRSTADPLFMVWDLSDHFSVMGHFNF
ncbi:sphingomyelin phosphodiesterase [Acinetobacter sp. WZC-1]|uniref:sphingomyelin phosphodiesterase n=1 Tax=Acinetobacter sp. WZC-1 TaxID=3459034 RepID=UPI00403DBA6B